MRWLSIALFLFLFGCAAQTPVTGNEVGGVVMHGGLHPESALAAAQKHCQSYGKSAKITSIKVQDYTGDPVLFDCL